MGSMDGRTVLVTGAGRGIGRAEALHLASLGANVVVNDPGVDTDGRGGDAGVAQAVVDEITALGGRAVADRGSVADWGGAERMVERAVAEFGDLHAVVNNAATEVNKGVERLEEAEFDDVVAVKLKGTFAVSRWAAVHWRRRWEAGDRAPRAIVNTASGSGLFNSLPAQSNYAAANAGVAALTTVHALELGRLGVRVNCVAPSMVRTRLTHGVPGMDEAPAEGPDPNDPAMVAPLVAYLAGPDCAFTGQVLSIRGGTVLASHPWTLGEHVHKEDGAWTVEELAERLPGLPLDDPFDTLAAALGAALGEHGREAIQAMVAAELDKP
ncbi:NAD(P)-dependent dehydrogenase, short-chain alcohol dehydrogenase family [Glycomyces sambucus]|uniref:NAD(P)-dependent dehydrogenase, short-chain alcohol dehydrogenase family n=1 Tax=Glycomyces sambucus TaxID=380244 RepID=A0A1G9I1A6_9ACTN|nr:SDR family NAD(P)-dependent oxidoreductase [Glycomyces sambucus]SDL19027.1 NAD(P)-dependent dehydrogenase, short-chain alcohol dehydrogenase family [Glycomyces sambucus]